MTYRKTYSSILFLCLFVTCFAGPSFGQETEQRKWTSKNGKFSFTGSLVEQVGESVKLKRGDNGKVIDVPMNRLSEADQEFLKTHASKRAELGNANQPVDADLRADAAWDGEVDVRVQWAEFSSFDEDGKEKPLDLELLIEAKGEPAAEAIKFGMISIDKCETNSGPIQPKEDRLRFHDPMRKFILVERSDNEFFNDHPEKGVRVKLVFDHPEDELKSFVAVQGQFKILTGGKRSIIKISDAKKQAGETLENSELKTLGVQAKVTLEEETLQLVLKGDLASIYEVKLVDKNDEKPDGLFGSGFSGFGKTMNYDFQFDKEESISDDLVFRLKVATDLEELTIPFDVKDVSIPQKK